MSKNWSDLRLKILKQQLILITQYQEHFIEHLGYKGYEDKINTILDEMLMIRKINNDEETD